MSYPSLGWPQLQPGRTALQALCASERISFIETSALDRSNVEEAFREVLTDIYRRASKHMPDGGMGSFPPKQPLGPVTPILPDPEPRPKGRCCS